MGEKQMNMLNKMIDEEQYKQKMKDRRNKINKLKSKI
jgi:hypothetical protein